MLARKLWIVLLALVVAGPAMATDIHKAINDGDLQRVKTLVQADRAQLEMSEGDRFESMPLHTAAYIGNLEITRYLVEQGATIDVGDIDASTPLMVAAMRGHLDLVEYLLDKGADVNKADNNNVCALVFAVGGGHLEVMDTLIAAGADLNQRFGNNNTMLHNACWRGQAETIAYLLDKGMDVDTTNNEGTTPLIAAASGGHTECVQLLLDHGADVNHKDNHQCYALTECSFHGNRETAALLLAAGSPLDDKDEWGRTPLFSAVWLNRDDQVALFLEHGADVNAANTHGRTPLFMAAREGNYGTAKALLKAGAEYNTVETILNRTPLHLAATKGYDDVTAMLIKAGAPLNVEDANQQTPIQLAKHHGNDAVVKTLTRAGAGKTKTTQSCQMASKDKKKKGAGKKAGQCGVFADMPQPPKGEAVVWYLGHSAMAVRTHENLLIFDYYVDGRVSDTPCLANGNICTKEIADQKVTVFSTHSHGDHYDPNIFNWRNDVKDITYVLGFKPEAEDTPDHEFIDARQTRQFGDLTVHTIESNDSGVGFLVEVDGLSIFHAGDHANRHRDFSGPYTAEIDYLVSAGFHPDLTMLPSTGCAFRDQVAVRMGIRYALEKFGPTTFFPMHASGNTQRYREVWDEIGGDFAHVDAKLPVDDGDWFYYKKKKSM